MKLAAFVALRLPSAILALASAELAEVLCGLWYYVLEELNLDPAQLLPWCLCQSSLRDKAPSFSQAKNKA